MQEICICYASSIAAFPSDLWASSVKLRPNINGNVLHNLTVTVYCPNLLINLIFCMCLYGSVQTHMSMQRDGLVFHKRADKLHFLAACDMLL